MSIEEQIADAIFASPTGKKKPRRASSQYDPIIEEAAKHHGVDPDDIRQLMRIESAGNSRAVSPKGAQGLMQLMPGTSRAMGVKDPFDVRQNIYGGTRYYAEQLKAFGGDKTLAAAAYNSGPGNVRKYKGVPPFKETQGYVVKFGRGRLASRGGETAAKSPEEQIADAIFSAPQANPEPSPEDRIADAIFSPAAAPDPAVAAALARRKQTLRQEPRQDIARLQQELMPETRHNLAQHPFVRAYTPPAVQVPRRPGQAATGLTPAQAERKSQPARNEFDPFTGNVREPLQTAPDRLREITGKAAEGVASFLGLGGTIQAAERAREQYQASTPTPLRLSKDFRKQAEQVAEIAQVRPHIARAASPFWQAWRKEMTQLPHTAEQLTQAQSAAGVGAGPVNQELLRGAVSQEEYDRRFAEAAERSLKGLDGKALAARVETETGQKLTPLQRQALGEFAKAERLKILHEGEFIGAVSKDLRNLVINYAVGLGAARLVGGVGRAALGTKAGQVVAQKAAGSAAGKTVARVSPLIRETLAKTIDPAQHLGAGVSNVAIEAIEQASQPDLKLEEKRARLNRAFWEGAGANLGIEAVLQGFGLGKHLYRGRGNLRAAEFSRTVDAINEMSDPELKGLVETLQQGQAKGARFGVTKEHGLVEIGAADEGGKVAVRPLIRGGKRPARLVVPPESLREFKLPEPTVAGEPAPRALPKPVSQPPAVGARETPGQATKKATVAVPRPRPTTKPVEPPTVPLAPKPMEQRPPSTAKPSRPLTGDERFAVDETVPVDERVEITHLGNLRRKGNAPFSKDETHDILELGEVRRAGGDEADFQLRVEDEEAVRIARETGQAGKWHKATDLPEEHFDLWQERVGNRVRTAQTVADALADEGTLDVFVKARQEWEGRETQAVQKRELRAAERELKGSRDDPQYLIDTAKGGSPDGPHTIVPEWYTEQDMRDIYAHLTKGGKRSERKYPNPAGRGTVTLGELIDMRLLPPDAFESAGAEASRTLRQKAQATATDPLDRYLKSLGGKKQVYASDVLKAQAEGGKIPASKGYGLSVNEAANLRRNLKNAQGRAAVVEPKSPKLAMREGQAVPPAEGAPGSQTAPAKRGRQALEDRLKVEVEERGLDPKVADATKEFMGLFPDKYLAELGSHYYDGARIPPDLMGGATNATGFYEPMQALIGIAREGVSTSKRGKRVPAHEIGHHLENFVPPKDYTDLQKAYEADRAKTLPDLQKRIAKLEGDPQRVAELEDLQAQGYRYESFHEWFAENVVDRGMRDIYPDDPAQRTLIQRVVRTIREVLKRIETYFTGKQRQDLIEEVYGKLRKGEYEAISRYGRQVGIQKYDVPAGALPSTKITVGEKKADAEPEKVRSFKTEAIPTAPNVPESPKSSNLPEKPDSSPAPVTGKPDDGVTITETERKAAVKPDDGVQRTGLKNRIQTAEIEAGVLPREPEKGKAVAVKDTGTLGKEALDSGRVNPERDAERIAKGEDIRVTPERMAAFQVHGARLKKALAEKRKALADAIERGDDNVLELKQAYDAEEAGVMRFLDNVQKGKTEWSNLGKTLQAEFDFNTGDQVEVLRRARAKRGGKLTPEEEAAFRARADKDAEHEAALQRAAEVEALNNELRGEIAQARQARQVADQQRVKAEAALAKAGAPLVNKKVLGNERIRQARKNAKQKEKLKTELDDLLAQAKNINIPLSANAAQPLGELAVIAGKVAINRSKAVAYTLDELVDEVRKLMRGAGHEMTEVEVIDAIAGEKREFTLKPETIRTGQLKTEARERQRLQRKLAGEPEPVRAKRPPRPVGEKTLQLRKKVKESEQSRRAQRKVQRLTRQVEDLNRRIAEGRGLPQTPSRKQNLSDLEKERNYLKGQIAKQETLRDKLAGKQPVKRGATTRPDLPETTSLREQVAAKEAADRQAASDRARKDAVEARVVALRKQIEDYNQKIAAGASLEPSGKPRRERSDLEKERDYLKSQLAKAERARAELAGVKPKPAKPQGADLPETAAVVAQAQSKRKADAEPLRIKRQEEGKARAALKRSTALDSTIADLERQIDTRELKAGETRQAGTADPRRQKAQELRAERARIRILLEKLAGTYTPNVAGDAAPASAWRKDLEAQLKVQSEAERINDLDALIAVRKRELETGRLGSGAERDTRPRTAQEEELADLNRRRANLRRNQEIAAGTRPAIPPKRVRRGLEVTPAEESARLAAAVKRMEADWQEWERRYREKDFTGLDQQQRKLDASLAEVKMLRDRSKRKVLQAIEDAKPEGKIDWLFRVYRANILSGVKTQTVNALSNAIYGTAHLADALTMGVVDPVVAKAQGRPQERFASETAYALRGGLNGIVVGARIFKDVLREGTSIVDTNTEYSTGREFRGGAANPYNWVGRGMSATDAWFKTMHFEATRAQAAHREVRKAGLKGEAAQKRFTELLNDPKVLNAAQYDAKYYTFNDDPNAVVGALSALRNTYPVLKFFIPFVSTGTNIAKRSVEHSPAGLLRLLNPENLKGEQATEIVARGLVGTAALTAAAIFAQNHEITAAAPDNATERAEFHRLGKQPYSVKVGDTWYAYRNFPVVEPLLRTVVAWKGNHWDKEQATPPKQFLKAAREFGAGTLEASPVNVFGDFTEMLYGPESQKDSAWERQVARYASGFVPGSGFLRGVANATDPNVKESRNIGDRVKAGIPVLSKEVPNRMDAFGQPALRTTAAYTAFLPPSQMRETQVPAYRELARLKIRPSELSNEIEIETKSGVKEKIAIPETVYRATAQQYGGMVLKEIHALMQQKDVYVPADGKKKPFAEIPESLKRKKIEGIIDKHRSRYYGEKETDGVGILGNPDSPIVKFRKHQSAAARSR